MPTRKTWSVFESAAISFCLLISIMMALAAPSFGKNTLLTSAELKQLHNAGQQPEKRLPLYISFVRTRMTAIQQTYLDTSTTETRNDKLSELLGEVTALINEMDDNIYHLDSSKTDVRKSLNEVIAFYSELQVRLRALYQPALADPDVGEPPYHSAIDLAGEALKRSLQHVRTLQQKQDELYKANTETSQKQK